MFEKAIKDCLNIARVISKYECAVVLLDRPRELSEQIGDVDPATIDAFANFAQTNLSTGIAFRSSDLSQSLAEHEGLRPLVDLGFRSLATLPISANGLLLGHIGLADHGPRSLDTVQEQALRSIEHMAADLIVPNKRRAPLPDIERLYEDSLNPAFDVDLNGEILWLNHAAVILLGYKLDGLDEATRARLGLDPDTLLRTIQAVREYQAALADPDAPTIEEQPPVLALSGRIGGTRQMKVACERLLGPSGALRGHRLALRDINPDGPARAALANLWRALSAHASALVTDINGTIMRVNEHICRRSGYDEEVLVGASFAKLFMDPPSTDLMADVWRQAVQGRVWRGELCASTRTGERFWCETTVYPHLESNGHVSRFIVFATDITDKVNLQARTNEQNTLLEGLRLAQEQYITRPGRQRGFQTLLDTLLEVSFSEHGFIAEHLEDEQGNAYVTRLASTTWPDNDDWRIFYDPGLEKGFADGLTGSLVMRLSNGAPGAVRSKRSLAAEQETGGGPRDWIGIPVRSEGRIIGFIGLANRTGRGDYPQSLVETLSPATSTLASLLLAERSIRERQRDQAVIVDQSVEIERKTELLQEVHHRIKNNLQIVSSLLSLQMRDTDSATVRDYLLTARNRVESIAGLHELIYRSPDLQSVALRELAERMTASFRSILGNDASRIRFAIEIPPALSLPEETAGPVTVIMNELISNAVKHAFPADRQGCICVGASQSMAADGTTRQITITVTDDGVGMPIPTSGSGLGMRIVSRLVDQVEGDLATESRPGDTRIALTIPLFTTDPLPEMDTSATENLLPPTADGVAD